MRDADSAYDADGLAKSWMGSTGVAGCAVAFALDSVAGLWIGHYAVHALAVCRIRVGGCAGIDETDSGGWAWPHSRALGMLSVVVCRHCVLLFGGCLACICRCLLALGDVIRTWRL